MKVDVLGTEYEIIWVDMGQDEYMDRMSYGGYCDGCAHQIVMLNLETTDEWKDELAENILSQEMCTLRHELIHAFLNESGLQWNCHKFDKAWAKNEEMVDWIAIQFPKILVAYQKAGCI